MYNVEEERFWDGGAAPQPPRFTALRQDSWAEGRTAFARSESRPLSRRSGCVSAEPYPPLRFAQFSRDKISIHLCCRCPATKCCRCLDTEQVLPSAQLSKESAFGAGRRQDRP